MNYKSSVHGWCAFDAQSDDARIRLEMEECKGAFQPLITFDGAHSTQEVQIRDEFRQVILSGPQEKRTEGDTIIREDVGALLTGPSNGLGVYTNGSPRQNETSGNGCGNYAIGSWVRTNGGRINGGRPHGSHSHDARSNGGRSNGSRAGDLGGKANRFWSQQVGRSDSSTASVVGSPDSARLPVLPASPTMTVAEWEKEDEDVAELSLGECASFAHEAEDLIDMA